MEGPLAPFTNVRLQRSLLALSVRYDPKAGSPVLESVLEAVSLGQIISPLSLEEERERASFDRWKLFELDRKMQGNQPFQPSVCNSSLVSKLDLRAVTWAPLYVQPACG